MSDQQEERLVQELHTKMDGLIVSVGEIKTSVALNAQKAEHVDVQISELKEQHKAFSTKLDSLASFQNYVKGAWAIVGGVAAWFFSHFTKGGGAA